MEMEKRKFYWKVRDQRLKKWFMAVEGTTTTN